MSNLVTISPGYVYFWGGRTQVISSQRKCTLSYGYVFSRLRFLQGTISPDTLTSWCMKCFLLICCHLLNSIPFCFLGSPWKMVCIWSGFLHKKHDISLEVRFFSSLPILSVESLNVFCVSYSLNYYNLEIGLSMDMITKYSLFSITSSEIIMKMSDSNSIIHLLLLSLDG